MQEKRTAAHRTRTTPTVLLSVLQSEHAEMGLYCLLMLLIDCATFCISFLFVCETGRMDLPTAVSQLTPVGK
jgi:hypothetical protein